MLHFALLVLIKHLARKRAVRRLVVLVIIAQHTAPCHKNLFFQCVALLTGLEIVWLELTLHESNA
jgi:hypothetical protein